MAKIYARLIQKGLKTIEQVPEKIKDEVQAILDSENEN
ncbi:CD1375 family protein [Enterococcus alishanensis]|nr:CD1375 family protein [Enterococcus alishanensis]